jgi:hypothetical protein
VVVVPLFWAYSPDVFADLFHPSSWLLFHPAQWLTMVETFQLAKKALGALAACWLMHIGWNAYLVLQKPHLHPVFKRLATLGPVDEVLASLENDINDRGMAADSWLVSPNWLVGPGYSIQRLRDIAWMHEESDSDETHTAMYLRDGSNTIVRTHLRKAAQEAIAKMGPWIRWGDTPKLEAVGKGPGELPQRSRGTIRK